MKSTNKWILPLLVVVLAILSVINIAVAFVSQPSNINWRVKNICKQYNPLSLHSSNNDDNDNGNDDALGRRGILKTLLGGALSMAATDTLMNAAIASISNNPLITSSALYRRILSFGSKYSNAGAVASTDLTAFVASQKGHIPEIQAWLAAQQKLQTVYFLRTAAASSSTATATTMAAARRVKQTTRGGGIVEEVLTVATAIKAGNVLIEKNNNNSTTAEDYNYTVDLSLDDAGDDDDDELDDKER